MTTLAANKQRAYEMGEVNTLKMVASDILYEGAAAGSVKASGHIRPLTSADDFAGFSIRKVDNSAGAAAALSADLIFAGQVQLSVSGAVITDVGQPVYATDDDTFVFSPVGGVFVGFVKRFVSSGVVVVEFDAEKLLDPWREFNVRETVSAGFTTDVQDNGKLFWVDTDALTITLAAVATPLNCVFVNGGAYGTIAINLSPNASDKIQGPNIAGTDNKDLINTKATANRGDFCRLATGDANGPLVTALRGTWATEA